MSPIDENRTNSLGFPLRQKLARRPNILAGAVRPLWHPTSVVGPFVVDDFGFHWFPSAQPAAPWDRDDKCPPELWETSRDHDRAGVAAADFRLLPACRA